VRAVTRGRWTEIKGDGGLVSMEAAGISYSQSHSMLAETQQKSWRRQLPQEGRVLVWRYF
jgi:hypothetical protein